MWANLLLVGGSTAMLSVLVTLAYCACVVTKKTPHGLVDLEDAYELESLLTGVGAQTSHLPPAGLRSATAESYGE
jgi:hypothetical protein